MSILNELDLALYEECWNRLLSGLPHIAATIKAAVEQGAKPDEIYQRIAYIMRDQELALTCEMVARWLARGK